MNVDRETLRLAAGAAARTCAVGSAVMLLLTVVGMTLLASPAASATDGGGAQVITPADTPNGAGGLPLTSGGSATPFSLKLPTGAACTGDSANAGYRVQSYMVPSSVDPSSLTFGGAGPVPTGFGATPFRQPLYGSATSTGFVDAQTANATVDGGPGPVINIPGLSLAVFEPGDVPAGVYNVGIACTLGPSSSPTQLDKFWNVQLTVVTAATDEPAGVTWTASPAQTTTTTSPGATTTSTAPGASTTSTTSPGGTTTTTSLGSTTTSTAPGATTSTTARSGTTGGSPTGTSGVGSVGGLPLTGSSTTSLVVWSVLFLVFGRIAVLLARPPRVKAAQPR